MYDIEREQIRKTYQLCRLGFFFLAAALSIACFESLLDLIGRFDHGHGLLSWIHGFEWYQWLGTPIIWGSAVGAILLWGRWNHTSWHRRAGLFLLMNLADLVLWFIARSDTNLAAPGDFGHLWLRQSRPGAGVGRICPDLEPELRLSGPPGGRARTRFRQIDAVDGGNRRHALALAFLPADRLGGGLAPSGAPAPRPRRPPPVSWLQADLDNHPDSGHRSGHLGRSSEHLCASRNGQ